MSRKRLVVSINSCWNFVNFRSGLVRALAAEGYEVVAVAPPDEHCSKLEALGCRFVPVPMNSRGTSPAEDARLFLAYLHVLRRERPAAYLAYTVKPNVYGSIAAHMLGIPVINNIAGLGTAFLSSNWLNRTVRFLYARALGRSRIVFFQNREDRARFIEGGLTREEQARLLPGSGVDLKRFSPEQIAVPHSHRFTFLFVARLLKAKGIGEYVEAARRIRRTHPEVRFQVAGILDEKHRGGVRRTEIELWAVEGVIEYLGALEDVRPTLAGADCVVLPTYYPEGTPRGLLEAAAMAKPIITTDVPGCRDVVEEGVTGFLCAPRDAGALASSMQRMLALPPEQRTAMGAEGRRKAASEFDEQIVVRAYLGAVEHALAVPRLAQ